MKYYKDTNNKPYAFDDNVTNEIITKVEKIHKTTLTKITQADYEAIIAPTFAELQEVKKQEIENYYNQAIQEPIEYNGNIFQADNKSVDAISSMILSEPTSIEWLDINNEFVSMTLDEFKGLLSSIKSREQVLFKKKVELKKQIEECLDKDCLDKIQW